MTFARTKVLLSLLLALQPMAPAMAKTIPEVKTFEDIVTSNLKFIANEQIQTPNDIYIAGEWPTLIESSAVPVAVGVGKPIGVDQEATAFTTGSVINAIASLYLDFPELQKNEQYQKIPTLIARGIPSLERYREGDLYNFYPPRMWNGVKVHQPADMTLLKFWKGFTNIPEDADTSSIVYTAKLYDAKIQGKHFQIPRSVLKSLETYRDLDRKAQFYNRNEKRFNTGAFMTWQYDEKNPDMPHFWFAAPEKGTRIPFNRNDVDCVVNLNVLRMLAMNQTSNIEGRKQSCDLINDIIRTNQQATCGIYYPNTFNLGFSMVMVKKAGESCIDWKREVDTVEMILKLQSADGGWDNDRNIWVDRVQSTAFAMNTLFELGDLKDYRVISSLWFGMRYLLTQMKVSDQGDLYWKGETFFTATAIARGLIIWKSNSYTTAVVARVLLNMQRHFPQYTYEYFQNLK